MRTNKLNLSDEVNSKTASELPELNGGNEAVINEVARVFSFGKSLKLKIANEKKELKIANAKKDLKRLAKKIAKTQPQEYLHLLKLLRHY